MCVCVRVRGPVCISSRLLSYEIVNFLENFIATCRHSVEMLYDSFESDCYKVYYGVLVVTGHYE